MSTKPTTIERRMKEQANAIMKAWKVLGLPLFIDTQHLGVSAPAGLATIFRHLNPTGDEDNDDRLRALPVTGPERNAEYKATVCDIISARKNGACYRIPPTFLNHSLGTHLSEFLRTTKLSPHYIHLIFDLGYLPNQSAEIEPLVMLICGCLAILPDLANWRTIAVAGSSFPENLSDLKSRINSIPRAEWQLWSSLSKLETLPRTPMFADYAIQHPTLPPSGFKGTANIRYTTEASWLVFKGSVLDERDKATSGVVQFKALARDVAQHPAFCKHDFSPGDEYIDDCANWETPSGQPTKWREVGTSHHITYVVYQLATDPDSLAQS